MASSLAAVEAVARRDRLIVLASLVAVAALCWWYLIDMAMTMGEIGVKSVLANNSLVLNAAAFYGSYTDVQVSYFTAYKSKLDAVGNYRFQRDFRDALRGRLCDRDVPRRDALSAAKLLDPDGLPGLVEPGLP